MFALRGTQRLLTIMMFSANNAGGFASPVHLHFKPPSNESSSEI